MWQSPWIKDHVQEIVDKWHSIDDEIWAKIICLERNRRIAKAYARRHQIIVDGSEDEYIDGTTLGLNSFENPARDSRTSQLKQYIGRGIELTIEPNGDIHVRRQSKANVFIHLLADSRDHSGFDVTGRKLLAGERLGTSNGTSNDWLIGGSGGQALAGQTSEFYGVFAGHSSKQNCANVNQQFKSGLLRQARKRYEHQPISRANDCFRQLSRTNNKSLMNSSSGISSSGSSSANNTYSTNSNQNKTKHCAEPGPNANNPKQLSSSQQKMSHFKQFKTAINPDERIKVFDMRGFKLALDREAHRLNPARLRLRNMCISVISFVSDDEKLLNLPAWIIVINIVALDLLSSRIGLVDPLSGSMMQTRNRNLVMHQQFNQSEYGDNEPLENDSYNYLHCSANQGHKFVDLLHDTHDIDELDHSESLDDGLNTSNGLYGQPGVKLMLSKGQLKESKRAFAQAAALGAYNGNFDEPTKSEKLDTKSKLAPDPSSTDEQQLPHATDLNGCSNFDTKQPSSGFDSQNSTSPATSLSNNLDTTGDDNDVAPFVATRPLPAPKSRGKRLPKLLPGMTSQDASRPLVSDPIPIPAPPTSCKTGPSGLAHLILVSPTGLSPPLSKRRSDRAALRVFASSQQPQRRVGAPDETDTSRSRCLSKQPSRAEARAKLMVKSKARLPEGIPSHAQLAPPATQRHILRYLMSTGNNIKADQSTSRPGSMDQCQANVTKQRQSASTMSITQRPLPVLPPVTREDLSREHNHHKPLQKQLQTIKVSKSIDESLYYCGLQARVPQQQTNFKQANGKTFSDGNHRYPMMRMLMNKQQQLSQSSGAINAILSQDFKQQKQLIDSSRNKQQRQQQSIARLRLKSMQNKYPSTQYINQSPNYNSKLEATNSLIASRATNPSKTSSLRPMFRFFRRSSSLVGNGNRDDHLNKHLQDDDESLAQQQQKQDVASPEIVHGKDFTSLEDIRYYDGCGSDQNRIDGSRSSFLDHVGGFLKRSSKKKCKQLVANRGFDHIGQVCN